MTASAVASRVKRGRGQGDGENYVSWLARREVASWGESGALPFFHRSRHHIVFSGNERMVALLLAWDPQVLDMKEQYPCLPVELTLALAAKRGVKHPHNKGHPRVRTLDFLVTHAEHGLIGMSFKPAEKLQDGRTQDLLQIEGDYCSVHKWKWKEVSEPDVPSIRAANLHILNQGWIASDETSPQEDAAWLEWAVSKRRMRIPDACARFDAEFGRAIGTAVSMIWHQLARKRWSTDLDITLDLRTMRLSFRPPTKQLEWIGGMGPFR